MMKMKIKTMTEDEPPPPPMINSFKEALEGIQDFLGCMEGAMDITSRVDVMANLKVTSAIRQTTLFDYV